MGHFDLKNLTNELPKIDNKIKCIICSKAKLKNKSFNESHNSAKDTLELIHFDLIGQLTKSIYGNKYIFTLMDDFSEFNWVLFLKDKVETFKNLKNSF